MKATIDISDEDLTALVLTDDKNEIIEWSDLSKNQQIKLLNSLQEFHTLYSRFIKE